MTDQMIEEPDRRPPDPTAGLTELAADRIDDIVQIRHDLHMHPELGLEEVRTSGVVAAKLAEWDIENVTRLAGTGLVATIEGRRHAGKAIGLRADMDALAILEANSFAHRSRNPGVMHACGHDGHTSMLLGAARLLNESRDFAGKVHLIFQPAEEGRGGAKKMLADGLFERFPVSRIYGMHSWPEMPVGQYGTAAGPFFAAGCSWTVKFGGRGGHGGAGPHLTQDLTVVAAGFVTALQTIVARNVSAFEPAIVSVGHISAGSPDALNVLPSELVVGGTMRCFDDATKELLDERLRELAAAHANMHGATCDVWIRWGAVPLVNDGDATAVAVEAASATSAQAKVDGEYPATTAGEDFSFLLQRSPGNFMLLGNKDPAAAVGSDGAGLLHTPTYDFNDASLRWGIAYWLSLVNAELGGRLGPS